MTERIGAHMRDLPLDDMREMMIARGEPEYRFRQLCQWMYCRLARRFDEMTDLPKPLRVSLAASFHVESARSTLSQISQLDGTRKHLFELHDGNLIEAVLMLYEKRTTLCVSTQVGCPLDCVFCETAKGRFRRNLTAGEMLDQICALKRDGGVEDKKVNVVFMGMGEPLNNYENVVSAIEMLNSPAGLGLAARQITVSTSGVVPGIKRLADDNVRVELAVSLHAASDDLRNYLVPLNRAYPLQELLAACRYFYTKTGRRPTFEYSLFRGINDSLDQAAALTELLRGTNSHANLIAGNTGCGDGFKPSGQKQVKAFKEALEKSGILATIREARGQDIEAGCGQLRSRYLARTAGSG